MSPDATHDPGRLTPRERQALDLCDCADGMSVPDLMKLMQVSYQTASAFVTHLVKLGRVTKTKAPGVLHQHHFANPAHAKTWLDGHVAAARLADAEKAAARKARKAAAKRKQQAKADREAAKKAVPKPPPVVQRTTEATNPNGVKPTVYAAPVDTRFRPDAGDAFTGEFSGPPGTDPITGKPWETLGVSVYERRRA